MLRPAEYRRPTSRNITGYRRFLVKLFVLGTVLAGIRGPASDVRARADDDPDQQAAKRSLSINNLKQIMIAMHNYHDTLKSFPPAFITQEGKPTLSWRVTLLPYFEGEEAKAVWTEFHLDEPWDSEHNKPLAAKMPKVYQSPASKLNDGRTVYLTPRGPATAFPGENGIAIRKITDGTSNTIAVLEVDDKYAVPWTKPDDWKFDPDDPKVGLGDQFKSGFNAAFCDGSIHFLPANVGDTTLKALFTRAGNDIVVIPD